MNFTRKRYGDGTKQSIVKEHLWPFEVCVCVCLCVFWGGACCERQKIEIFFLKIALCCKT